MKKIKVTRGGCGICYTDANGVKRHALKTPENGAFECGDEQAELPHSFFKENLALIIVLAALLIITAVLSYCIFVVPAKSGVASGEYLRNIFDTLLGRQ